MIAWFVAATAQLTLGQVERMTPAAAGRAILAGQPHRPIVSTERDADMRLRAPGLVELDLIERAVAVRGGCTRQRWRASFQHADGQSGSEARLRDVHARTEVVAGTFKRCPDGDYTNINAMTPIAAIRALRRYQAMLAPGDTSRFRCEDQTRSRLCGSDAEIRRELARSPVWHVQSDGETAVLRLGERSQPVTEVRLGSDPADRVTVRRFIPAPP